MVKSIIISIVLIVFSNWGNAQNLLLNGGFEKINPKGAFKRTHLDSFYCLNWFTPTDGSVDLFRDIDACDEKHIIGRQFDYCVETVEGDYCIGIVSIDYFGEMEHITGTLHSPLEENGVYKVSYYCRNYSHEPYFTKGFGYKFSTDSVVFNSELIDNINSEGKLSSSYHDLFKSHKVYSDYQHDNFITDTNWRLHTSYFRAKGGEKFITFGQFAFKNDKEIIKQMDYLRINPLQAKYDKFVKSGKSLFITYVDSIKIKQTDITNVNYYLLDNIKVEKVTDDEILNQQRTCDACVDNDPSTVNIPNRREVFIDRGYEGEMTFTLHAELHNDEKFVIELDKGNKITIINNNATQEIGLDYQFTYPAKKIRGKSISFFVEKMTDSERKTLETNACIKENYQQGAFNGTVHKCLK